MRCPVSAPGEWRLLKRCSLGLAEHRGSNNDILLHQRWRRYMHTDGSTQRLDNQTYRSPWFEDRVRICSTKPVRECKQLCLGFLHIWKREGSMDGSGERSRPPAAKVLQSCSRDRAEHWGRPVLVSMLQNRRRPQTELMQWIIPGMPSTSNEEFWKWSRDDPEIRKWFRQKRISRQVLGWKGGGFFFLQAIY